MLKLAVRGAPELLAEMPDRDQPASWLSPGELGRWQRFAQAARRDQFLAGRWLLRCLLAQAHAGDALDPPPEVDAEGRSFFPGHGGLYANLSHSGPWLAAVLASEPVGIDIEGLTRKRDHLALAQQVHSPAQCAQLAALPEAARALPFHRWWTLKEAQLKSEGQGLDMTRMRRMEFDAAELGRLGSVHLPDAGLMLAIAGPACGAAGLPERLDGIARPLRWQVYTPRSA